ncbi:serine/threonine protein kinase [Algoriphagus aestuarii]|nr:serine/threonine protein kinase [Algoriphagus aestuarii]
MIKGNWEKVEKLFHQIVEADPENKQSILDTVAKEDLELFNLLKGLIESDGKGHRIFEASAHQLLEKIEDESDLIGMQVGAFQLESIIGSGAMGTVFQAKRIDGQFDQTVAIKILRSLVLDSNIKDFFNRERQILAKLNHPNIARLYDGGFTETERPFFTMEYVAGKNLLEYCQDSNLDLKDRLKLFFQVCAAVQYAHQNLIVHLDLKPQNIIVNKDGQVRLLDFGVSKILEDSEDRASSFTLAYASPEQIEKKDAGTPSDIYSLGLILFQLSFGRHPFQQYFEDLSLLKNAKISGDFSFIPSDFKSKTPFISDLKYVCSKALELDPESRYVSVDEMQRDVKLFLSGYPISSHPKNWTYSFSKYLRRNTSLVASISIAFLLLTFSGIYYTKRLSEERNIAQLEAEKANQVTDLLSDVFMAADPNIGGADTITAVQLLNEGKENLERNLGNQPELFASIASRLAGIYFNLGVYDKGRELIFKAYEINKVEDEISDEVLADNETQISAMYYLLSKYDSSLIYSKKAISRLKNAGVKDGEYMASALTELGNVLYDIGDFERADSAYLSAYQIYSDLNQNANVDVAFVLHMIGANARENGKYEQAEKYLKESLAMKKELFEEPHLEIAYTYNHLGSLYQSMNKDSVALGYIKESLDQRRAILGEYHVETMASMANYARTMVNMGLPDLAIPIYNQTLIITDSLVGKEHVYYWALMGSLGTAFMEKGEMERAKSNFQLALENYQKILPESDPRIAGPMDRLGKIAMWENDYQLANTYFQKVLEIRKSAYSEGHPQITQSQQALGECLLALGDYSTAIEFLKPAFESYQAQTDVDEAALFSVGQSLISAYEGINDREKASFYQEQLAARE